MLWSPLPALKCWAAQSKRSGCVWRWIRAYCRSRSRALPDLRSYTTFLSSRGATRRDLVCLGVATKWNSDMIFWRKEHFRAANCACTVAVVTLSSWAVEQHREERVWSARVGHDLVSEKNSFRNRRIEGDVAVFVWSSFSVNAGVGSVSVASAPIRPRRLRQRGPLEQKDQAERVRRECFKWV